jgi:phosphoglycolate phosphatase
VKTIIFDLDGTLVDSAPGILRSYSAAFDAVKIKPTKEITKNLVGPPLLATMKDLAGTADAEVVDQLIDAFKVTYDEIGYRETTLFPLVGEMLEVLASNGCSLYIATNKRKVPTDQIIASLVLGKYFKCIYAIDSFNGQPKSKSELLRYIVALNQIASEEVTYVGDRNEDGQAAAENSLAFLMAGWGYELERAPLWPVIKSPMLIAQHLSEKITK